MCMFRHKNTCMYRKRKKRRTTPWTSGLQHLINGWVHTNVSDEHLQQ